MKRLALALLMAGCSGSDVQPPDDSGTPDAGTPDDSGTPDAGTPDDSGTPDAGTPDAGIPDAGAPDSGFTPSPHRAFPALPKGGGHVLSPMTLVTLVAANDPNAADYGGFSDALIASQWFPAVASEYGAATPAASLHVTIPAIFTDVTETMVVDAISAAIDGGAAPPPDGNTLYLVYLPAPHNVLAAPACAYHKTWYRDGGAYPGDGWGVVGQCTPFRGGETAVQANTRVGSHEIIEAVTDSIGTYNLGVTAAMPWTKSIWSAYEAVGHVEVGDLCEGTRIMEGGWEYQRSWSNVHAAAGDDPCLPANPGGYFSVSAPQDWYAADAGTSVTIPFTGWSTAARGPWLVKASVDNGSAAMRNFAADAGFWTAASMRGPTRLGTGCLAYPGMNDGEPGALKVDVPAAAHAGDWISFYLSSFEEDPQTCYPFLDRDDYHFWLVGVYVP